MEEGGAGERFAHTECGQAVLGEAEVEEGCDGDRRRAELFLLFEEVGAADLWNVLVDDHETRRLLWAGLVVRCGRV